MRPESVVVGVDDEQAGKIMRALYRPFMLSGDRMQVCGHCQCRNDQICLQQYVGYPDILYERHCQFMRFDGGGY